MMRIQSKRSIKLVGFRGFLCVLEESKGLNAYVTPPQGDRSSKRFRNDVEESSPVESDLSLDFGKGKKKAPCMYKNRLTETELVESQHKESENNETPEPNPKTNLSPTKPDHTPANTLPVITNTLITTQPIDLESTLSIRLGWDTKTITECENETDSREATKRTNDLNNFTENLMGKLSAISPKELDGNTMEITHFRGPSFGPMIYDTKEVHTLTDPIVCDRCLKFGRHILLIFNLDEAMDRVNSLKTENSQL